MTVEGAIPSPAPWRNQFLDHVKTMDLPTCAFSTVHYEPASSTGEAPVFAPRCRTVVFRGMWASLPINPKNPAPLNPPAYETDLLTITNDARMEKTTEIFQPVSGTTPYSQTGGGGPIEAVFWAAPSRTQWRVRGRAYVLGPDIDSEAATPTKKVIEQHMRPTGNHDTEGWEWGREVTAHFGNLSPGMRGSFRNPAPGKPLSDTPGPGQGLGQKVDDLHDKMARENFRVVIIIPEELDRVDLSNPDEAKRWNYRLIDNAWVTTELWP